MSKTNKKDKNKDNGLDNSRLVHWADVVVKRVIAQKGDKKKYVVAAGITPSGVVHIGNFREIITVDLVAKAFRDAGKEVRFIYSWDDYDVLRKVPKNMPNQDMLKKHLRKPIVDIPDPFGTEDSYARHHEVDVENDIDKVDIRPEFLYQAKKYRKLEYVDGIRTALKNTRKIKEILDQYRKEPLEQGWMPLSGYCPECNKYDVTFSDYDGNNMLRMTCSECNKTYDVDIRKAPYLKLPWRVDWPMRWAHERVDFEPGGKDHSTVGGSYYTAKDIVTLFDWEAPSYEKYDFVSIKGLGGKISSSIGNVITLRECLEIYEPEIVRYLFAGTQPKSEFAISFDLDVIKIYEDFDKCERVYFGEETIKEKKLAKEKRIYELSCVKEVPKKMPFQPSFRHLTNVIQTYSFDEKRILDYYKNNLKSKDDEGRLKKRMLCAENWLKKYAPDDFKYEIQTEIKKQDMDENMKKIFSEIIGILEKKEWNEEDLHSKFYEIARNNNVEPPDFFKSAYNILVNKERGPKLAHFIIMIGQKKVAEMFSKAIGE
ncbi:MAG: lysine--tRNA ligase [Candidatus Woesearchaeota archaeon]